MTPSRRDLLKIGGMAAAAAALPAEAAPAAGSPVERRAYPQRAVVDQAAGLAAGSAVAFHYPDAASPCVLLKVGREVPAGVGPDRDLVAFSIMCTHQGCLVAYDRDACTLKCPCHFSLFDVERAGRLICGQATAPLPRIALRYEPATGGVVAVGVVGQIYGRQSNIL